MQESGIWSRLFAKKPRQWERPGIQWGWFRMSSHLCADVKLFSTLCFQHQRHQTAPFAPSPGDYLSLADLAAGKKFFLIFNPISPLIPCIVLVPHPPPEGSFPSLGCSPQGILDPSWCCNYSSADLHVFHTCLQTGKTSWMNPLSSESFSWALTSSISLHLVFDL